MKGLIVGIEGVSCAGKTTLCQYLRQYLDAQVVEEAPEFVGGLDLCPPPPRSTEDARRNERFYLGIEVRRWQAAAALRSSGKLVVMDRSILSLLALSHAFERIHSYTTYRSAVQDVCAELKAGRLGWPDLIVHLDTAQAEVMRRNPMRPDVVLPEAWVANPFHQAQQAYYQVVYRALENSVVSIDGSSDCDSVGRMAATAVARYQPACSPSDGQAVAELLAGLALP